MLRFVKVDEKNFENYRHVIVNTEKFFNPKIRTPLEEYLKIVKDETSLTLLLYNHNVFIGSIIGYAQNKRSYYLFSLIVQPKQRGKGYGKSLFNNFRKIIKKKGYVYLKGHYNASSQALIKCYKPCLIKREKRWEGTQAEYKYLRIKL